MNSYEISVKADLASTEVEVIVSCNDFLDNQELEKISSMKLTYARNYMSIKHNGFLATKELVSNK